MSAKDLIEETKKPEEMSQIKGLAKKKSRLRNVLKTFCKQPIPQDTCSKSS
jgi:hypothetical protein